MKELSIEGKARAYDEAYKVAENIHRFSSNLAEIKRMEEIFPELKESEDKKIRKALINVFSAHKSYEVFFGVSVKDIITWLEKQGEQKVSYTTLVETGDGGINAVVTEELSADKVKPKFKIGDYIISNNNSEIIYHITGTGINELGSPDYVCEHVGREKEYNGRIYNMRQDKVDANFRLWTIQDAKDGDVLAYRDGQWIFIYKEKIDDNSFSYYTLYSTIHQDLTINDAAFTLLGSAINPATKEQRGLLFQKMKEAGYEWNAEKKELEKIIDEKQIKKNLQDNNFRRMFEQKPAEWSEEDENKRLTMKLIDKDAVIAEIERKKICAQTLGDNAINGSMQQFYDGMKQGFVDILSFLNTLEVKEFHISKNNLENYQNN